MVRSQSNSSIFELALTLADDCLDFRDPDQHLTREEAASLLLSFMSAVGDYSPSRSQANRVLLLASKLAQERAWLSDAISGKAALLPVQRFLDEDRISQEIDEPMFLWSNESEVVREHVLELYGRGRLLRGC